MKNFTKPTNNQQVYEVRMNTSFTTYIPKGFHGLIF